tara:strand:- start:103 stop:411 length:309 start_codon:yes stop_codon:yes gene_type:complete
VPVVSGPGAPLGFSFDDLVGSSEYLGVARQEVLRHGVLVGFRFAEELSEPTAELDVLVGREVLIPKHENAVVVVEGLSHGGKVGVGEGSGYVDPRYFSTESG